MGHTVFAPCGAGRESCELCGTLRLRSGLDLRPRLLRDDKSGRWAPVARRKSPPKRSLDGAPSRVALRLATCCRFARQIPRPAGKGAGPRDDATAEGKASAAGRDSTVVASVGFFLSLAVSQMTRIGSEASVLTPRKRREKRDSRCSLSSRVAGLHARSLAPLVKARGLGMTPPLRARHPWLDGIPRSSQAWDFSYRLPFRRWLESDRKSPSHFSHSVLRLAARVGIWGGWRHG